MYTVDLSLYRDNFQVVSVVGHGETERAAADDAQNAMFLAPRSEDPGLPD